MATFLEIKTDVQNWVIDLPTAVQNSVPGYINKALVKIQNRHDFKVMEGMLTPTTTIGVRQLALLSPTTFKKARGRPFIVREDGTKKRLIWALTEESLLPAFDDAIYDEGEPMVIVQGIPTSDLNDRPVNVFPYPDGNSDYTDGEYRVKIPYWRYLPALSADGDTNWFTINATEYLTYKAIADAFSLNWDMEQMAVWLQKAEVEYKEVVLKDKLARLAEVNTLVPHQDVNEEGIEW